MPTNADSRKARRFFSGAAALLLLFFVLGKPGEARHAPGEVIYVDVLYVIDGDSLMVSEGGRKLEVRLWGIDAPEFNQPYAASAKKALASLVAKKALELELRDIDRYGRVVALARRGGITVNEELVRRGYAWVHVRYCLAEPCEQWFELERAARKQRAGLWRQKKPVPPWRWRADTGR